MPRPCTVCVHPERREIDLRLGAGVPNAEIAQRHRLSRDAVKRHKANHLAYLLAPGPGRELADVSGLRSISVTTRRTCGGD